VDKAGQMDRPMLALRLSTRFVVGAHGMSKRHERVPSQPPGQRDARFVAGARALVAVHRWEAMNTDDTLAGPAVINGSTLTCPVPPGWRLAVDDYGNAKLDRA
jgi:N-methylhydantoinase A/oxoprolinase/acetone carboxylase beta subunit